MRAFQTVLWLFAIHGTLAALYTDQSQLPARSFDFVIVGAGAAGNVLARRLTENPDTSVLVIEAGISNEGILSIEVPFLLFENLPQTQVTWNYSTVPQVGLNDRVLSYSRGRVLGGSSSINFMTYTRGSNADYDRWANLTGDDGWSWRNLEKYYRRSSRLVPTPGRNTTGLVDPAAHGHGPVQVSLSSVVSQLDSRVLNTSKTVPEFPFNLDIQSGNSVGVFASALEQSTIGNGTRSSSAVAYLEPALHRKNLHVLIQHTVTRLIPTGHEKGLPTFKMVEFAPNARSPRFHVSATKEVILSAGAVNTPQLLMLSGIGDRDELASLGIRPQVHIPDVGKHLQDHPIAANYFQVTTADVFDSALQNQTLFGALLAQWQFNRTGPFAYTSGVAVAFLRLARNSSIFANFSDPTPDETTPHFEMLFGDRFAATDVASRPLTGNYITINTAVVTPFSLGSVRLASTDPFTFPLIDPNYFASPFDRFAMVEAVKAARRFVEAPAWRDLIVGRFGTIGSAETDEEIVEAARNAVVTIWHPVSSARMSPVGASWGVLDPNLRVKGTEGLRVVDASAFPIIPAGHTVAFVYVLAERASDIIKEAWTHSGGLA